MTDLLKRGDLPIWIILLFGFTVRMIGINFGLPDLYHADEPIIVNHAVAYGTGDLNPHFFKIPPLTSYLLFIAYILFYLIGKAIGRFSNTLEFQNLFFSDPSNFYLIGRILFGAVCGTVSIYLFYRLLDRFFSRAHAIWGSFLFSLNFLHVRDSHYIYADIPLLLVIIMCFSFLLRILEDDQKKNYFLFGLFAGIAVAIKYNAVFIFVPFVLSYLIQIKQNKKTAVANVFLSLIISVIAYSFLNPYSWLDFHFFKRELLGQANAESFTGFFHHIVYSLNEGLTFPILILSLFGILIFTFRPEPKRLILFSFIFIYYVVLALFSQPYDRYALPLIPFMVFFAVDFVLFLKHKFNFSNPIVVFVFFISASVSVYKIIQVDRLFIEKDVRTLAREWIEGNIQAESKIALDIPFYMPRLKPSITQLQKIENQAIASSNPAQIKKIRSLLKLAEIERASRFQLFYLSVDPKTDGFLMSQPKIPYEFGELKRAGIQFLIMAGSNEAYQAGFRKQLEKQAHVVAVFNPYQNKKQEWSMDERPLTGAPFLLKDLKARERNGLPIKIYQLNYAFRE